MAKFQSDPNRDETWSCSGPGLIVIHGEKREPLITRYGVCQNQHHTFASRELAYKFPYASYGEWLLFGDDDITDSYNYCIVNAVTMQKFQLPPVKDDDHRFHHSSFFLLSGYPGSDVPCTVYLKSSPYILYCEIGADKFTIQECEWGIINATIFQGSMFIQNHWEGLHGARVGNSSSLQFEKCIDGLNLIAQFPFLCFSSKLVGFGDKLFYIMERRLDMGVMYFEIYEADLCEKTWKKVHRIGGDRAIFLDDFGAFSAYVQPGCGIQGDCIYYTPYQDYMTDDPDHVTLFAYDLRDQCVTMLPALPFKIQGRTGNQHVHQRHWINCQF